jgi:flavin reductase
MTKNAPVQGLEIDPRDFRRVMGQFATGVTVLTTVSGGEVRGMTANAFMSGSLNPPLCVVSIAKRARMHEAVQDARRLVVNVLAHEQMAVALHFAGQPRGNARIDIGWIDGIPSLRDAIARMAANVVAEHDCGDHTLFLGHLFHMDADRGREPLLYHQARFGSLVHTREDQKIPVPEFW